MCKSLPLFSFIAEMKSVCSPSSFVQPSSSDAGLWDLESVWTAKPSFWGLYNGLGLNECVPAQSTAETLNCFAGVTCNLILLPDKHMPRVLSLSHVVTATLALFFFPLSERFAPHLQGYRWILLTPSCFVTSCLPPVLFLMLGLWLV